MCLVIDICLPDWLSLAGPRLMQLRGVRSACSSTSVMAVVENGQNNDGVVAWFVRKMDAIMSLAYSLLEGHLKNII
jgi:hypothetical protein